MNAVKCDLKAFIARCAGGDSNAKSAFQHAYGPLIYTFPVRIFHLSKDKAGDFYLYVFEKDRIFKRIQSFEGRNAIHFETYLSYYVLRDLFLEWIRATKQVETIPLETPVMGPKAVGEGDKTLYDILPAADPSPDVSLAEADDVKEVEGALQQLDAEKRLALKLLALGEVELEPVDIRLIAQTAKRSIRETLELVEEIMARLSEKQIGVQEKQLRLHAVSNWIFTYQRRMTVLKENIRAARAQGDIKAERTLVHEKAEIERKLAWRYRQQAKLRQALHRTDVQPSYKDIARLLNVPVGTVCSRIARAREELWHKLARVRRVS